MKAILLYVVLCIGMNSAAQSAEIEITQGASLQAGEPLPDGPFAGSWEKRSSYLRGRIFHSAIWTYSEMIVWGGGAEGHFHDDGGIYNPDKDEWRPLSKTNAPSGRWGHAALWTGREMIIWGGRSSFSPSESKNDGALYNPITDTWRPMSKEGAPEPRSQMAAVWTGRELLVWGGWSDGGKCPSTGGSYNVESDTWSALPLENAPVGRVEPAYVWTDRELIVWGGLLEGEKRSCGTGGRYDPESKTWKPLPDDGAPPSARGIKAVWSGREMVIWGGSHLEGDSPVNLGLTSGARYNPESNTWLPTATDGAPDGRLYYAAAWNGTEMLVWGGGDQEKGNMKTGALYNPSSNRWRATAIAGAPSGRGIATAVWTGEGVLIFGGSTGGFEAFNETFYFRAKTPPESPLK